MIFLQFFSRSLLIILFSCFFYSQSWAAGSIPRDGLRLELLLATGSQDTSGNNRIIAFTGATPIYQIDPIYGVPFAQFGSGILRANTAWSALGTDDFAMSVWIKISDSGLINNQTNNSTTFTSTYYTRVGNAVNYTYFDKPMVLFSTKTTSTDAGNLRLALSKEGMCSINSAPKSLLEYSPSTIPPYSGDVYAIIGSTFDCTLMKDGKWHNIVLMRKSSTMTMFLDGNSVWSAASNIQISRNWSFGGYPFSMDIANYYSVFPQSVKDAIYAAHFYKGGMAGYRLYSRALADTEIEALVDEFRYAQSDLIGAGNIQVAMEKYAKPSLYVNFKKIPNNLTKDSVIYEYALDAKTFLPLSDITQNGTGSGTIDYRIGVDLSGKTDGRLTLTFRVRSVNQSFQNIGTVSFMKIDTSTVITINQPNTDLALDKTITATALDGQLYMAQTRSTNCDVSITTWEDYSDLTFSSKNDNGIRVCYKAIFSGVNKIIYKLSTAVQGIQSKELMNTNTSVFNDYLLWTKSIYQKPNDTTAMMLDLLGVSPGASQGTINGVTMTDINGDGLVDFLYSNNTTVDANYGIRNNYRAIVVNNGNYTFKPVYKCVNVTSNSIANTYYGDCADSTR